MFSVWEPSSGCGICVPDAWCAVTRHCWPHLSWLHSSNAGWQESEEPESKEAFDMKIVKILNMLESHLKSLIWHLTYKFDIWYLTHNTFNEYLLFGLKHLQLMSVFHDRLYAADIPLLSFQYVIQNNIWVVLRFFIIFLSTKCWVVANIVGLNQFFCFSSFTLSFFWSCANCIFNRRHYRHRVVPVLVLKALVEWG